MIKYLITPSLINGFNYYLKDDMKTPKASRAEFFKILSRERFEPNEAMQKGIDFENDIQEASFNNDIANYFKIEPRFVELVLDNGTVLTKDMKDRSIMNQYINVVESLSKIVNGGIWQQSCTKTIAFGNFEIVLYGRCDVIKEDIIYDIKYTNKYEIGKFQTSIQHLIYMYCLNLPRFSYLVSNGADWWREDYVNDSGIEDRIISMISDFFEYLKVDLEAKRLFHTKWQSKY